MQKAAQTVILAAPDAESLLHTKQGSMQRTPTDNCPVGSVPKTTYDKGHHKVEILA